MPHDEHDDVAFHAMHIEDLDYASDVSRRHIPGVRPVHKFGHNLGLGTTLESITSVASSGLYVYPATAEIWTVSSSDTDDTIAGSGARTVLLTALDGELNQHSEIMEMNGQNGVSTTRKYLRFITARVLLSGSSEINEGIIHFGTGTITAGLPANEFGRIDALMGRSLHALYTIPKGHFGLVLDMYWSLAQGKSLEGGLYTRDFGGSFNIQIPLHVFQVPYGRTFRRPLLCPGGTDIELRGKVDQTTIDVAGGFELDLWDNFHGGVDRRPFIPPEETGLA